MGTQQTGETEATRWRVSVTGRVGGVLVLLGWLALTLGITVAGNKTPGAGSSPTVVLWILLVIIALGVWRFAFVPNIEATETDLVVRNAFKERRIPWTQIKAIEPGSLGLIIVTKNGGLPRTAWAVQKGRGARLARRRGRADQVIDALMVHVRPVGT